MKINMSTPGVHHIALRSTDLARSRRFYVDLLGFPVVLEAPHVPGDTFDPFRVGRDHLALGCADEAEPERVAAARAREGVENTGVKLDPTLQQRYVAFKDPDRIAWELYIAPNVAVPIALLP